MKVFFEDDRPGYWQPERLTMMAEEGFLNGLRWMFPMDADELLQAPDGWRDALNKIDEPGYIKCDWVDFAPHAEWNGRHIFGWKARLAPRPQPKLIVHWRPGMQFGWGHHVMWSKEREVENPGFWVAHYPFRSREFVEREIKQIG